MSDHEYVSLFSNVANPDDHHSLQDQGRFMTILPHPIQFNEGDMIGLHEYFITDSWFDLTKDSELILKTASGACLTSVLETKLLAKERSLINKNKKIIKKKIDRGRYGIAKLIETLKSKAEPLKSRLNSKYTHLLVIDEQIRYEDGTSLSAMSIEFIIRDITMPTITYNELLHTIEIENGSFRLRRILENGGEENRDSFLYLYWDFSYPLKEIIGAEALNFDQGNLNSISPYLGRPIEPRVTRLLIYCDAIQHHRVGNVFARLLKIIQVPEGSKYGLEIHREVRNIQYFKPAVNEIREITIDIRTDSGELVDFRFGRVILILDIKRKEQNGIVL